MRRTWQTRWLGYAVAAVVAGFSVLGAAALAINGGGPFQADGPTTVHLLTPAPSGVRLTNPSGQSVPVPAPGRVTVVAFVGAGPSDPSTPALVIRQTLADLGSRAHSVAFLGVNTDPLHTSVQAVRRWSRAHGLGGSGWQFLTGPPSVLLSVWNAYHVNVTVASGRLRYTGAIYVIDDKGQETYAMLVNLTDAHAAMVAAEASKLVGGIRRAMAEK